MKRNAGKLLFMSNVTLKCNGELRLMSDVTVKGCLETGGVGNVFSLAQIGGRLDLNRFTADLTFRHSIWGVTVAHCFIWLVHGFSQSTLQRISSIKTLHGAKVAYLSLTLFVVVYGIVFCFFGLLIFAYFSMKECDPYEAGLISNRNQLAPFFVLHAMSDMSGMRGLYVAILCCGSISTLSSGLNALAANTVEDLLRWPLRKLREGTVIFITKLIVTAYGGLIIGLAYLTTRLEGSVIQMATTVFGAFGSPILGIFLMGASFPWANKYGALVGAAVSLSFNLWIGFGRKVYGTPPNTLPSIGTAGCSEWAFFTNSTEPILETNLNNSEAFVFNNATMNDTILVNLTRESDPDIFVLYRISYEWYSLLGTLVCVSVGLGISLFTKRFDRQNKNKDGARTRRSSEAQFIFPFLRKFWNMETSSCNNSNDVMYETGPRKSNKQCVKLLRFPLHRADPRRQRVVMPAE
ncbi:hypothetical protein RRG08_045894 [Elysia crispata]|uniref:Sodium-coupled monocarboxylate transporter 2 n=1 Tax=Elysia crispata TaxID=231223 RepID=A0AAE1AR64_9GAST|nr:hypothetical protein RRG08_045894 [Elysia crispata]